jgi:predicted ribosome quality control (RQC) complex YloA/Tae2 family protein
MHNNYYFLRQLTPCLTEILLGSRLQEAFSQNRDELVLEFALASSARKPFYLKAYLDSKFCCLQIPERFHRAKKNSVDLFPEVQNAEVTQIRQFENERSFAIYLQSADGTSYQLLFKMHGNRANVILFQEEKQVVALFKNALAKDTTLRLGELDRALDTTYEHFEQAMGKLSAVYPTLGKIPKLYLQGRNYDALPRVQQWELLQQTIRQLEQPKAFLVTSVQEDIALSLLPTGAVQSAFSDPIAALNVFFLTYIREVHQQSLKKQLTQRLTKEKKQTESYWQKARQRIGQLTSGLSYQQTADLIMANLHALSSNTKQAEVFDFYHQQPAVISLNPRLSPQKNAENYYRKAKNQKIELAQAQAAEKRSEERLNAIAGHLSAIASIDNPQELQAYADKHRLLPTASAAVAALPYHRTQIAGYDVFIGKSAKSNDALLREQARKDDLWLHAKDVSGSHVLIKKQGNQPIPRPVIELAARWAAYASKRKHDSLAPVIYTPCKYVRKGKNMPPGAVRVEREEVILVEPKAFSGQNDV